MERRALLKLLSWFGLGFLSFSALRSLFYLSTRPPRLVFVPAEEIKKRAGAPLFGDDFILLVREGVILAFSRKCPHLGCKLNLDAERGLIVCPCHQSKFDMQGRYLSGPAKRDLYPLRAFPTEKGINVEVPA